jgi:hypothetical protein
MRSSRGRRSGRGPTAVGITLIALSMCMASVAFAQLGNAAPATCGTTGGHTICVSLGATTLTGDVSVTVTNSPNTGTVFFSWSGASKASGLRDFMEDFGPSPETNDYSFVWPTEYYPNASGSLQVKAGSNSATPVSVAVTLSNPKFSPKTDWANYLPPTTWSGTSDPTVVAVGDGPDDQPAANAVSDAIANQHPDLVPFLGDVYETGTYVTMLNHYGVSSLNNPGGSTLWGRFADVTQPTIGNHETKVSGQWQDYWHGRPLWTSYTFGNVLFLELDSSVSMASGSAQYQYVQQVLSGSHEPPCIVSYWHIPPIAKTTVNAGQTALWKLIVDNGGDLALAGHLHYMAESVPLNDSLAAAGSAGPKMTLLIVGSGGHSLGGGSNDKLHAWSKGNSSGYLKLALNGAANTGTPKSLGWTYFDVNGNPLRSNAVGC